MQVKDLISILSKLDPEKDVFVSDEGYSLPIRQIYERKPDLPGEDFISFYVIGNDIHNPYNWRVPIWTDPLAGD